MRIFFWSLALTFFLIQCTSLHKKASNFLEEGAYGEAVQAYEQILKENPEDPEAKLGLIKAHQKFIDAELLKVRFARQGNQEIAALETLQSILEKEAKWNEYPKGAAGFTQDEEIREGSLLLQRQIEKAISNKRPLQADYYVNHFYLIFAKVSASRQTNFQNQIKSVGKVSCLELKKINSNDKPFYFDFTLNFCNRFGMVGGGNSKTTQVLWKEVNATFPNSNIDPNSKVKLVQALKSAFSLSPWYEPNSGRKLNIPLDVHYSHNVTHYPISLTHQYFIQEPYTAYVQKTSYRNVPHTYFDSAANEYRTDYRQEPYTEEVPVTQYRDVPKFFNFSGLEYTAAFSFSLSGSASGLGMEVPLSFNEEQTLTATTHDTNMPQIGLHPKALQLASKDEWITPRIEQIKTSFQNQLSAQWETTFCSTSSGKGYAEEERIFRCLRLKKSPYPDFVEQWFQSKLGTTVQEAQTLIK